MKIFYLLFAIAVFASFIWLNIIIKSKVVADVHQYDIATERLTGAVFGIVSSSANNRKTTMLQPGAWKIVNNYRQGWEAVGSWSPIGLLIALISGACGFALGAVFQQDRHAEAAAGKLAEANQLAKISCDATARAEQRENAAYQAQRLAETSLRQAEQRVRQAEQQTVSADERTSEAERKLVNERERYKNDLNKAGARIAELKKRNKKTES